MHFHSTVEYLAQEHNRITQVDLKIILQSNSIEVAIQGKGINGFPWILDNKSNPIFSVKM